MAAGRTAPSHRSGPKPEATMVSRFIDVNRHSFENVVQWRTPNFVATYRHLQVEVELDRAPWL
jgi:hypothetical protein